MRRQRVQIAVFTLLIPTFLAANQVCQNSLACSVHGSNRLGGNSLLECTVFGNITGKAATQYVLGVTSN